MELELAVLELLLDTVVELELALLLLLATMVELLVVVLLAPTLLLDILALDVPVELETTVLLVMVALLESTEPDESKVVPLEVACAEELTAAVGLFEPPQPASRAARAIVRGKALWFSMGRLVQ